MKEVNVLELIEHMAKKNELDASLFKPTKQIPYDVLTIFLGTDNEKRPYILNITAQQQVLDPKKESGIFRVVFKVKFPFKISDFSLPQTSSLIAFFNHYLDLPGLEINEVENELFYRHVLLIEKKGMHEELVLSIIGIIKFILDVHAESIESVASGKISYDDLLKQALKV